MNFTVKVVASAAVAVLLEVLCFNFQTMAIFLDTSLEKNIVYTCDEMLFINWNAAGDGSYISGDDPQILIPSPPMKIVSVDVALQTEPASNTCVFFYTAEDGTVATVENQSANGFVQFSVDQPVDEMTRIDVGDAAGTRLTDISVTINPAKWNISLSRIAAVVLIYLCGSMLFRIQRMPDYGIVEQLKKKEDEKT